MATVSDPISALPHPSSDALPVFYDMFRDGIKNTWTVKEVDFQTDLSDLKQRCLS